MSQKFWEEFIKIYESEPCLWQIHSKQYYDRTKKEAAYARLIEKIKTVAPAQANRAGIVKKINNIRCAYRKELKKVRASLKSGTSEVYEPTLWYYNLLRFLDDVEAPRKSLRSMEGYRDDTIVKTEELSDEDMLQDHRIKIEPESTISDDETWEDTARDVSDAPSQNYPPNEMRLKPFKENQEKEDRFHVFGKSVAIKLRGLSKEQMLLAEKLINDTLFQAEMGNLTLSHKLVSDAEPQN